MRQGLKDSLPDNVDASPKKEEQPKFSVSTNENGHQMLTHNHLNRHERRAKMVLQKQAMKKFIKGLQLKAKIMQAKAVQTDATQAHAITTTVDPLDMALPDDAVLAVHTPSVIE